MNELRKKIDRSIKFNDEYVLQQLSLDIKTIKKELDKIVKQADDDTSEYVPKQKGIANSKRIQVMLNNIATKLTSIGKQWVQTAMSSDD